ncbi:hypothetical protein BGZ52_009417, partial [Haplosporangium bisporale]
AHPGAVWHQHLLQHCQRHHTHRETRLQHQMQHCEGPRREEGHQGHRSRALVKRHSLFFV